MKKIFVFISAIASFSLYAQDDGFIKNFENSNVAYYADSILIGSSLGIDWENNVADVYLEKGNVVIDGNKYDGKLFITLKQKADLISLEQISKRYIGEKIYTPVYLINGNFMKGDLSSVKIDNNYILRVNHINSDKFANFDRKKSAKFTLVLIFTKTEENIKRASEFLIR
ncbi:MAG: hypothetical protein LBG80_00355 [Bacteroidales bacterium]|jgi:hypothetical protein|nr:hypothetical protein [Bacteroidales bacterium]